MKNTFTAIDFETAHGKQWSICQIGLVRVENGLITDELNILVQPPDNFYWSWFIDIHGITPTITKDEPTFTSVWPLVEPYIKDQIVVAHNGFSFDFHVLAKTLEYYGIENPEYEKHCTYRLFRKNLASLCHEYNIPLNHHDALNDARACAKLYLIHMQKEV